MSNLLFPSLRTGLIAAWGSRQQRSSTATLFARPDGFGPNGTLTNFTLPDNWGTDSDVGDYLTFSAAAKTRSAATQVITSDTFSISAWFYPTNAGSSTGGAGVVYQGSGSSDYGISINLYSNAARFFMGSAQCGGAIADNAWHHMIASSNNRAMSCFINGVAGTTATGNGSAGANPMYLGFWYDITNSIRFLDGRIGPVFVWDRVITARERAILYACPNAPNMFACPARSLGGRQIKRG